MPGLDRRVTVVVSDGTKLPQWAERTDSGVISTTDTERDVPPPATGVWAGVTPHESALIDLDRWTVLGTNGQPNFGPWKSPKLGAGQPININHGLEADELIMNRSQLGLEQNLRQFVPSAWPIAVQYDGVSASYWYCRRPAFTSTDAEFRVTLWSTPVQEQGLQLFNLTTQQAAAVRNLILTPYAPAPNAEDEVNLKTAYYDTRVYRVRYDERIARGGAVVDGGESWTITETVEARGRERFLDVSVRRRVAKLVE